MLLKIIDVYLSKVGKNQSQKEREEEGEATTHAGKRLWPFTKDLNDEG